MITFTSGLTVTFKASLPSFSLVNVTGEIMRDYRGAIFSNLAVIRSLITLFGPVISAEYITSLRLLNLYGSVSETSKEKKKKKRNWKEKGSVSSEQFALSQINISQKYEILSQINFTVIHLGETFIKYHLTHVIISFIQPLHIYAGT